MNDFELCTARATDSILRIRDRLSNAKGGAAVRAECARIFGERILGHQHEGGGFYLALPFQTALLTDPVLYIVGGGLLLLDHPTQSGQGELAIGIRTHIVDLNRKWSLYENRYPRMIAYAKKGEKIEVSWMLNNLMRHDFQGPFAKVTV